MKLVERQLSSAMRRELEKHPIVALTGARQSGKTTLINAGTQKKIPMVFSENSIRRL